MKMQRKKVKKTKKSRSSGSVNTEWEVTDVPEGEGFIPAVEFASEIHDNSEVPVEQTMESVAVEEVSDSKPKKRKKGAKVVQRSEASLTVSEFNLNEVGKEKVKLNELIKTSQKLVVETSMMKQLENAKKLKSLSVPMSKPEMQKIKRTIAYEKVCDEVSKWDSVVNRNRSADQIVYPLKKPHLETFEKASDTFVTKHPIEIAVAQLLNKSENTLDSAKPLTVAEEKALQAMSLEEAKLRHNELMKHRALISYQEAKARRQNKIKSKSYHRILKREKLRKIIKEFEQLEKVDAAAALEKIMEADKLRVLERMTLKHRNTGKWAKIQKLRAKYNPDARTNLKDDLIIGRQFKEKLPMVEKAIGRLRSTIESQEEDNSEKRESVHEIGLLEEATTGGSNSTIQTHQNLLSDEEEESVSEALPEKWLANPASLMNKASLEKLLGVDEADKPKESRTKSSEKDTEFVDMEFISKATALDSYNPSSISIGDNMDDRSDGTDDDEEAMDGVKNVSEAFADEDLIAEFREEKKTSDENNRPKGIDLYLPGWGSWTGPDIKDSIAKKRKFFIQPLEDPAPKKKNLGSVIFNEDRDKKASVHQVSQLPFPFTNVTQFESHIRQPLGHTWNPPSSFQNLNEPKVVTKMGKVIQPIDAEDLMVDKKSSKKRGQKRKTVEARQPQQAF